MGYKHFFKTTNYMNVKYIYHIADLHIRNLKRHKEYKMVFDAFLERVRVDNLENSIIYIGGDLVHAKTEMSPELIKMMSWFLTQCAELKPTFVITGNHDCNLNNSYRLDAISPIVEYINNPNLHYLKNTGVYRHENITFVVYSILDNKENWPTADSIDGETKICLFHGPVNKAETDIGYSVSSKSFTTDMFDGFDMVLMGDIHKRQTLQNYDKDKKLPIVNYCGSMIQQNHGELLEGHGYLLWDIEEKTYKEFDIKNEYGYLTVDIESGEIPQWVYDEKDTKLPKYPKLRLRFSDTPPSMLNEVVTKLKTLFNPTEVTITRTDTISKLKQNQNINENIVGNVKDEAFQIELIRSYLEQKFLLGESDLDEISEIHKETNSNTDDTNMTKNIVWYPKEFEFSNMFSYGENNKIRFNKAKGIIGIFAPNASGKSSLFDALSFCVYDKTSRTYLAKHILNNRKTSFECKFNFEIDGIDYFIERTASIVNKGKNVKVDVNFWQEEDGVITSLNGEQRRDTNQIIQQYLGTYDDFVLTTLSLQGNNALFIDKSQRERKDILAQFIGVDVFDKLYTHAVEENRENRTIIKKFNKDEFTSKLVRLKREHTESIKNYKEIKSQTDSLQSNIDELNDRVEELSTKIIPTNTTIVDIDGEKSKLYKLEENKKSIEEKIDSIHKSISELETEQLEIEDVLDDWDGESLESQYGEFLSLSKTKYELNEKITTQSEIRKTIQSQKEHLDTHKYDENCEICMENSKSIRSQKEEVNDKLEQINININNYDSNLIEINEKITKLGDIETLWNEYKETKEKYSQISQTLDNRVSKLLGMDNELERIKVQIQNKKNDIDNYYENENTIKENSKVRFEIDTIKSDINSNKSQLKQKTNQALKLNGSISSLKNQIDTIDERIDEIKKLEKQNKLYEYYLDALSRDGISYELITKALPVIESEVNNILGQVVEFGMQLEMDGKNINAYIVYDDQKWSLEMCSGMERFISGLAIRIALINVCNLPRPNFLVIDEGFGTLDSENLTSLYMLFTYLKTQFDFVMIISHIDSMRDVVDELIDIKKVNGFSYVKL